MSNFLIQRFLHRLSEYNISYSREDHGDQIFIDIFNIPIGLDIALASLEMKKYVRTDKTYGRTGAVIESNNVYEYENCCQAINSDTFPKRNFIRLVLDDTYYCNKMNMVDACIREYISKNGW